MDTDPPMCLDYIFFKGDGVKVHKATRLADKPDDKDPTIYGSDHLAISVDFEITF